MFKFAVLEHSDVQQMTNIWALTIQCGCFQLHHLHKGKKYLWSLLIVCSSVRQGSVSPNPQRGRWNLCRSVKLVQMSALRMIIYQTKDQGLSFSVLGIHQDLECGGLIFSAVSQTPLPFLRSSLQSDESGGYHPFLLNLFYQRDS